jgi:hypothetical protein
MSVQILLTIIFGISMLSLGVAILAFPNEICTGISKCIGDKKWIEKLNSAETTWSFKLGGLIAIIIGGFTLFMCLKYIFWQ